MCPDLDNSKYPFNELPVLEVNGIPLCQSMTIMRYLAKEHGMAFVEVFIFVSYFVVLHYICHIANIWLTLSTI